MSIADKLTQLATIRSNIRAKLTEKGVEASAHNFSDFASDIESIETGITPTGSINITENGAYDVSEKAEAVVEVAGVDPDDTFLKFLTGTAVYFKNNSPSIRQLTCATGSCYQEHLEFYSVPNNTVSTNVVRQFQSSSVKYINIGKPSSVFGATVFVTNRLKSFIIRTQFLPPMQYSNTITFLGENKTIIYVPDLDATGEDLPTQYKNATNWSKWAENIKGYSEAPDYDASVTYEIGDVCKYNNKFYGYCKRDLAPSTGNAPSGTEEDNLYWEFVDNIEV